jgi:HemY protein
MLRLIAFLIVLLGLAFGFSWLADNPGDIRVVWLGYEWRPTVMLVAILIATLVVLTIVLWSFFTGLVRTPEAIGSFFSRRRREKGWQALSRGMIAVGAGDPREAGRLVIEARRILGDEPLALLLEAQSAQAQGDFQAARGTFEKMLTNPETKLLGLRGLYVEANREGEAEAARHFAEEAVTAAPKLVWAGEALVNFQAEEGDFDAAIVTLDRNLKNRIVERTAARRLRAVLLTASAQQEEEANPDSARNKALEAHGLAPDLVPAALIAARLLIRVGDIRKASKVLEANWRIEPHPDVAEAYTHVRPGDTVKDRLARAKELVKVRGHHPEAALALARAELGARDFAAARATLKALIEAGPTRRCCLLMAEIDEAEFGASPKVREWLTRAVRAPRDPQWTADGHVFDAWQAVSPVSGKLDAFTWAPPAAQKPSEDAVVIERLAEQQPPPASPAPTLRAVDAPVKPAEREALPVAVIRPDDPGPEDGIPLDAPERRVVAPR